MRLSQARQGSRLIDRLEPRYLMSLSSLAQLGDSALLDSAITPAQITMANSSAGGSLVVSLKVPRSTLVHQSRPFPATVTVTNTGSVTLIGVVPLVSQSTGDLLITKLASPSIASLAAGKSIVFKYTVEELLPGAATADRRRRVPPHQASNGCMRSDCR